MDSAVSSYSRGCDVLIGCDTDALLLDLYRRRSAMPLVSSYRLWITAPGLPYHGVAVGACHLDKAGD
jgi:hypothetical protein